MPARALRALALFALVAYPRVCLACPVCFDPRESNRSAFISMTIFMSLLPLGMFAGLVLWLRGRLRDAEGARAEEPTSRPS